MTTSFALASGYVLARVLTVGVLTALVPHDFVATPGFQAATQAAECPVTQPNGETITTEPAGGNHGNDTLVTSLWPGGKIVFRRGGPGFVLADGALSMKFGWWRRVSGSLTLEGRRLDGQAPPMRASIPDGYGLIGFQSTALIFPTPGCWQVTGHVGSGSLTFVTLVEKIGDGPVAAQR